MGNEQCVCCQEVQNKTRNDLPPIKAVAYTEPIAIPKLSDLVTRHLISYKPFRAQLTRNGRLKKYGNDVYEGEANYKNRPQGYGTMYFHNGCVFVGQFDNGLANGPGHYVFPDGSYYHGKMYMNQAQDSQGEYNSQDLSYKGGLKGNMFQGKGEQKGEFHQFKGTYHCGKKVQGVLSWTQLQYNNLAEIKDKKHRIYAGTFDGNGQFHGQGKLTNEFGEYRGQFQNGKKHGKGEFDYKVGIKYVGNYIDDIKQGEGTIYSKSGSIAFCGEMKNGLPNGKGYVMNSFGDKVYLSWIDGLDQRLLETKKQTNSTGVTL